MVSPFLHWRIEKHQQSVGEEGGRQDTHSNDLAMSTSIPVRVRNLDLFHLHVLLHLQPLLPQLVALFSFALFPLTVGEEVRLDAGVLAEFGLLRRGSWGE